MIQKQFTILLVLCFCVFQNVFSQEYYFRKFSLSEGLPQASVSAMVQDSRGYVWVGTAGGAARFDGKEFEDFTTKEGVINNRIETILEDKHGNIWIGTHGGVSVYTANALVPSFVNLTTEEGLTSNWIYSMALNRDGNVVLGTRTGVSVVKATEKNYFDVNPELVAIDAVSLPDSVATQGVKVVFASKQGDLWLGTSKGLYVYGEDLKIKSSYSILNGLLDNEIFCIEEDLEGNLWCGTARGVSKLIFDPQGNFLAVENISESSGLKFYNVKSIHCNKDGSMWMSVPYLCLYKKDPTSSTGYRLDDILSEYKGLNSNSIDVIMEDREQNTWFGSSVAGLSIYSGRKFEAYTSAFGLSSNNVRAIIQDDRGDIWFGTSKLVSRLKQGYSHNIIRAEEISVIETFLATELKTSSIWSLFCDNEGVVWIGGVHGLYFYDGKKFEKLSDREGFVGKVVMRIYQDREGQMWFSSFEGVTVYDKKEDRLYRPFAPDDKLYDIRSYSVYQDDAELYWLGSNSGLSSFDGNESQTYTKEDGLPSNYVSLIVPDRHGNLWLGTGHGISRFDGKSFKNFSTKDGLSSDTPYLMIFDDQNKLWVGTNRGLDRLTLNSNSDIIEIRHYGEEEGFIGIETNANAVLKDQVGDLWFGTMGGAIKYNAKEDKLNKVEPKLTLSKFSVDFEERPFINGQEIPYDHHYISFNYSAISNTIPAQIRYKFKLDGFDTDWSPETKESFTTYSKLPPGVYKFQVMACNNDGVWNHQATTYSFSIETPFWLSTWFYLVSTIGAILILVLLLKLKTDSLKLAKIQLEEKVKTRTAELRKKTAEIETAYDEISTQKEEIEFNRDQLAHQNKNITDSIQYAKRIQDSILPPQEFIKELLKEFFIFYRPKDIVSGDFYFVEVVNDSILFGIVDCTGHGVPGALMSIVGHGHLSRAVVERRYTDPGKILMYLDRHINDSLHGKDKAFSGMRDGMDISLCSLNIATKELRYAGANNPLYVIRNTELKEYKPNKQSLGPKRSIEKYVYDTTTIQLEENDAVYIFSDGYADQFGGSAGKKFKYRPFKAMLSEMQNLSMEDQKVNMVKVFDNWRGNLEQVDDVCIFGLKV